MMKSIVDENLVSFKMLEQKIYDYVCELGRLITQQVLESYDAKLAESRDKKTYRAIVKEAETLIMKDLSKRITAKEISL